MWVSPFWEGKVADVVATVGWDKVMFGSDWPHPEGLAEAQGYWKHAEGCRLSQMISTQAANQ